MPIPDTREDFFLFAEKPLSVSGEALASRVTNAMNAAEYY